MNFSIPKKSLIRFYLNSFLLAMPFLVLILWYVVKDPFMVIRSYDDYDSPEICQSEGAVGWYKYTMFRAQMHYDSFIMGSSSALAFNTSDWNRYIHAYPFRLFSNGEGLVDLRQKLDALDRQPGQHIKNLLIVCERGFFTPTDLQKGIMHVMPPEVSGKSEMSYQVTFLQGFFNPKFLGPYLRYYFTHKYDRSMLGVMNSRGRVRTRYTNDDTLLAENEIREKGERYWDAYAKYRCAPGDTTVNIGQPVIHKVQIANLKAIRDVCRRHHTDVKIIIGPTQDAVAMNPVDNAVLCHIFGHENVVDYSGRAGLKFRDYHNFYDDIHYRVAVGRAILHNLYSRK